MLSKEEIRYEEIRYEEILDQHNSVEVADTTDVEVDSREIVRSVELVDSPWQEAVFYSVHSVNYRGNKNKISIKVEKVIIWESKKIKSYYWCNDLCRRWSTIVSKVIQSSYIIAV